MNASRTSRRTCHRYAQNHAQNQAQSHAPRFAYFVDIENLVGGPIYRDAEVRRVWGQFESTCPELAGSALVMATSHPRSVVNAWCGADKRPRMVFAHGRDGADRALLAEMDVEHLARTATHVVIGSGDGVFAPIASQLASLGLYVCVVSRPASLSNRLLMAAHEVRHLAASEPVQRPVAVAGASIAAVASAVSSAVSSAVATSDPAPAVARVLMPA